MEEFRIEDWPKNDNMLLLLKEMRRTGKWGLCTDVHSTLLHKHTPGYEAPCSYCPCPCTAGSDAKTRNKIFKLYLARYSSEQLELDFEG